MAIRILVTGVNGQLAQSLAERAASRNAFELVRVGRPLLDLERPDSILRAVTKVTPDVIVNAAAYTAVDKAEDERELATRVNSEAPGILAWAARATGARLVHVSTDYVYDGRKTSPYIETDRVNPLSVYGRTKLEGEERVRAEYGNHIILRTAWLYSPFSHNFVRTILRLSETRCHLTVVNDQRGTPTSALDLADAILAIVSRWRKDPQLGLAETYHCAGTGETTWFGLARQVLATSREAGGPCAEAVPILSPQWPAKAARPSNSCLDCTKLARDFGWQAPGWQSSLRDVVLRLVSATENATA